MLKPCATLFCLLALALWPCQPHAAPMSTSHYGLDLPADWVVADGPVNRQGATQVLLGRKDHKASASIVVGPSKPGDAAKAAASVAKRLNATKPEKRNGQLQFLFEREGVKGFGIVREDAKAKLLLVLIASGDLGAMDFLFRMRGPYPALKPVSPGF